MEDNIFSRSTMTIQSFRGSTSNPRDIVVDIAGQSVVLNGEEVKELAWALDIHIFDMDNDERELNNMANRDYAYEVYLDEKKNLEMLERESSKEMEMAQLERDAFDKAWNEQDDMKHRACSIFEKKGNDLQRALQSIGLKTDGSDWDKEDEHD